MFTFVRDHLGSTRAIVDIPNNEVCEENDYYAFGGTIQNCSDKLIDNRWRYAGKEEQSAVAHLPYLDYGARLYNPGLGRWLSPDPMAEKYYGMSPYNYCADDPILHIDRSGKWIETAWDVANVMMDVSDLHESIQKSDDIGTIISGVALVGDVIATGLPFIPAGFGTIIKVSKATDVVNQANNVVKATETANDVTKSIKKGVEETITFSQGHGPKVHKVTVTIPEGYKRIGNISDGETSFTNGDKIISPDRNGHNGGVWKMWKNRKAFENGQKRMGTYDKNLNKIHD